MVITVAKGVLAAMVLTAAGAWSCEPAVVPNPASLKRGTGEFRVGAGTAIRVKAGDVAARQAASYLADLWKHSGYGELPVQSGEARDGAINVSSEAQEARTAEGYRLEASAARITLSAPGANGLIYASGTLWQLACREEAGVSVPSVVIDDAPRFAWRGLLLDSARHFQSPEFIRRFIDSMALHKLNVLHWHLTDDQAWRLEIRKYPRLTSVGAWRVPAGAAAREDIDPATGKPRLYGGFYTQSQVRSIVAHAATRGVTIVPEIDLPGHASAAIVAYPQLAADPKARPTQVPADWGVYSNVYAAREPTFRFLEDVFTEVIALFPGRYVHIGGDEVQDKHVQPQFTKRLGRFLDSHGRRLVGWDEILEGGVPPSAVVMSWRGIDGAITASSKGYDTVLAPDPTLYFDNRQGLGSDEPPGRLRILASLESVYAFEPMPTKIPEEARKHVLGLQGNLWTEHIRTEERVAWMAFPRAAAIAELGWSQPERRDWRDFERRVSALFARYDALGVPHADSAFAVEARITYAGAREPAKVALSTQTGYGDIRYTMDGSTPTAASAPYAGPFEAPLGSQVHASTFDGNRSLSRPRAFAVRKDLEQRRTSQELKLGGNAVALAIEDDAPLAGARAVFSVDLFNPRWIFEGARLDGVDTIVASVGQVPFNFQVGDEWKKVAFSKPQTREGELEVRLDDCDGEVIARLALAPAASSQGVTTLRASITPRAGTHNLCLRFAQHGIDPFWVLDWVQLTGREVRSP
jgi:hexosaminidase